MAESSINMKFTAQTADAQKRIAELEKEVARLTKETKASGSASSGAAAGLGAMGASALGAVAGIAAATVAVKAFISAAKECVEALKIQEQAEARLNAVLKASGNQIGMTVGDLKQLASATQSITRFGDEAVIEAEKVLIATQSLDKEGLQRALMSSADLAEAMGTDIVNAASTMAYALQDPEAGLTRLRRQGIAFTDEEIAQVKALQDANDLFGAQAVVLEKIESRYQGVAKAVADTPTGTLDKIKNVWSDIKEGLGKGLLDSISPALETLYGWLRKISQWVADSVGKAGVLTAAQRGESLTSFSDEMLASARAEAWERMYTVSGAEAELMAAGQVSAWEKAFNVIDQEIARRKTEAGSGAPSTNPAPAPSAGPSASGLGTESAISAFMKANGSASTSYKYDQYQKVIDQARELREQMFQPIAPGASMMVGNIDLMNEWGMSMTEFSRTYEQLGEIIDDTVLKQENLYKAPEEAPAWLPTDYLLEYQTAVSQLESQLAMLDSQIATTTDPATLEFLNGIRDGLQGQYDELTTVTEAVDGLDAYLQENAGLSATAQQAALDARIAEAETWRNAENLGEQEIKILDEIIAKLKEQRGELVTTSDTWQDVAKKVIKDWSPVVSQFSNMTGAVAGYITQMWDQQASEMEAALDRDRKAGELSEEEEAERQKKINDLRRKSFEAEKANSMTNALINGALAVTKALAEMGPVAGPIAAGLIAATTAVQVATISAQQFTPMANGGIVTSATPIIAGEAGPEAIIPLSGGRAHQYLDGATGVVINITIQGNADEDMIFHAIERAQRTGYLPNWSYV